MNVSLLLCAQRQSFKQCLDASQSKLSSGKRNIEDVQGGHGTGKTGNLVLTFSRQGKHREFCFGTGKNFETQGKCFSVTQGKF